VRADLPGPTESLYFAGAKLNEIFPLLNLLGTESLGIGALSYAGQFNIMHGLVAEEIDAFAANARNDLRALAESVASVRDRSSPT
jgi:diacylglycerol O-acyltransferase / wax synthase